jgi:hypothetical protein
MQELPSQVALLARGGHAAQGTPGAAPWKVKSVGVVHWLQDILKAGAPGRCGGRGAPARHAAVKVLADAPLCALQRQRALPHNAHPRGGIC